MWQNFTEVSARKGKFRYQYRQFSLMCHSLAHKRELSVLLFTQCCESTATHGKRGTWRGGTSRGNTYIILCKLFRMVEFISTSLSLLFLRVWSIIEEVKLRLSRNEQTPASRERMKSFFLLLLDSIVLF